MKLSFLEHAAVGFFAGTFLCAFISVVMERYDCAIACALLALVTVEAVNTCYKR